MDSEKNKVSELFKNKSYYSESLKWYNAVFVAPKTELALSAIFAIVAVTAFFISFVSTVSIFPLSKKVNIEILRPINANEVVKLKSIGKSEVEPSISYAKHLISEYVRSREEYIPLRNDRNFYFVVEMSSEEEFTEYQSIADPQINADHPVWQFGSQATRKIEVSKVSIPELGDKLENYENNKEYTAIVDYKEIVVFLDDQKQETKKKAEVKFSFLPIIIDQESGEIKQLPKLLITDYKLKE